MSDRVPSGVPSGGQFAAQQRREAAVALGSRSLPSLGSDGKETTTALRRHLETYGLIRDGENQYNGAENRGWIQQEYGSTGFSVSNHFYSIEQGQHRQPDRLRWHVVISGKTCGLAFLHHDDEDDEYGSDWHETVNAESLHPKFKQAFTDLGLKVAQIKNAGHQTVWDDDVYYEIETNFPPSLGPAPR